LLNEENSTMETPNNDNQNSLTPTRNAESDIIKGASDQSNIDAMQHNAKTEKSSPMDTSGVTTANIFEAINGATPTDDGNDTSSPDLNNPATRGI
jgi:hypothetical protein